ncbi:MAG TPA: crosslink repair DNA glycosylase YcaQ family protein, partial [Polyangia bacterium]|nr:crosslink repair DNA glycosylase YcaQ family protein [Polyangia bacterium]
YRDRSAVLSAGDARRINAGGGLLAPTVVVGGRVVGTWRRTLGRGVVTIALSLFGKPAPRDRIRIEAAAERYGAFLGLETNIV